MTDLIPTIRSAVSERRKLLSIYLTAGFPELSWTIPLAAAIFKAGADMIELGVPFSDPIADGPTIQDASTMALRAGTKMRHVMEFTGALSRLGPVLLMGYSNTFLVNSRDTILTQAAAAGACGLIIPDLLHGEEREWVERAFECGLPVIPFAAPTTSQQRMEQLNEAQTPFVYAVSVAGVTGARDEIPTAVIDYLARARRTITRPILVGFGVSDARTARAFSEYADGVIVGSAVIRRIKESQDVDQACERVAAFVGELRSALARTVS